MLTAKTASEIDSLKTRIQDLEQQLGGSWNVGRERLQAPEDGYDYPFDIEVDHWKKKYEDTQEQENSIRRKRRRV